MEFKLSKSQKDIQKAASDFAKGEFDKELAIEMDRNRTFPQVLHQKASELGFIGIHFNEAYMGGGLGFLENVLMAEELCRKDATMGSALMLAGYGAECLLKSGSRELKEAFIATCKTKALTLIKKEKEFVPPKTHALLYDEIMKNKNIPSVKYIKTAWNIWNSRN